MNIKTYPITLQIPDWRLDLLYKKDTDILKDYPLKLSYVKKYHNTECYAYALKNRYIFGLEEAYEILKEQYRPISKENIQKGDIITYHNNKNINADTIEHFAIISQIFKTNKNTYIKIKSKWGICGIYEGSYDILPEFYGTYFCIWQKNKLVKNKKASYNTLTK